MKAQFDLTATLCNTLTHFKRSQFGQFALPFNQKLSCVRNNLCTLDDSERSRRGCLDWVNRNM
jgi:hypothetical protein